MQTDIQWKQRFQNFEKAFLRLNEAIIESKEEPDRQLLQAGLVQTYEFTLELAWKTLKDYLSAEKVNAPTPRETIRQAFQAGFIIDAQSWLEALDDRNRTSHIYNETMCKEVIELICTKYLPLIKDLHLFLKSKYE